MDTNNPSLLLSFDAFINGNNVVINEDAQNIIADIINSDVYKELIKLLDISLEKQATDSQDYLLLAKLVSTKLAKKLEGDINKG